MLTLVLFLALPAGASAAVAGEDCYPDGCTEPTSPPPSDDPSCGISLSTGQVGDTVTATVVNVPTNGIVRILFDGSEVASNASDEQAAGPQLFRGASSDVVLQFTVPDVAPGTYSVVAVGDTFSVTCGDGDGNLGFTVLASTDSATPNSDSDGALAFTGGQILGLLLIGALLLLLGALAVRWAKRRRETFA